MLSYYFRLALKSMRRTPVLSALMVIALGLGIGAFMTTYTVYHLMSDNPIPHKSDQLFAVQLDNWDPNNDPTEGPEDVQPQLTYQDVNYLMTNDTPASNQVATYRSSTVVQPEGDEAPFQTMMRISYGSFFDMFDVPMTYGRGWSREDDDNGNRVVVLSKSINDQIYGGENSVGQQLRINDTLFEIIGVMGDWNPIPKFYDPHSEFDDVEDIFIPFNTGLQMVFSPAGNVNCWKPMDGNDIQAFLRSECVWIQFWAELPEAGQPEAYLEFLNNYSLEQRELGRFPRPINNFINNVMEWMDVNRVVSRDNRVLVQLSALFLLVCILNTVGILLAKFLGKSPEVALRRAMGASRRDVFVQNLIEVITIGIGGGLLGIGLAWLGLKMINSLYRGYENLVHLDWMMLITAISVAVAASVLAGLYPVYRTARFAPAGFLKTQ